MKKDIRKLLSLYLVIDKNSCKNKDIFYVLKEAIKGGVTIVQLREKYLSARELINLGKKIKSFLRPYNIPLIINDRIDIALAIEADGVHVGQEDIHPLDIKKIANNKLIIGFILNICEIS